MYQKAGHATAITVIRAAVVQRRSRGKANEEKCFAGVSAETRQAAIYNDWERTNDHQGFPSHHRGHYEDK